MIIRQFNGQYACRDEKLTPLRDQALSIAKGFVNVTAAHVPREKNEDADKITREILAGTFQQDEDGKSTAIAVTFTVKVILDRSVAKQRLAAGATANDLRKELAARVSNGLPRAINVGDAIEVTRRHG